jgi:hypothetical protein
VAFGRRFWYYRARISWRSRRHIKYGFNRRWRWWSNCCR